MTLGEAKIPMLDLAAQHAEIEEELLEGIAAVLASGRFVLGQSVERYESELAERCGVRHAIACNSGTDALWLSLAALGIGSGDAVLCPAYSFFATAATIVRLGASPVFCDIDPATLNLSPADAIARLGDRDDVRAIVAVDLFGRACELGDLEHVAGARDVPIVADAAQSIEARDATGRRVGERTRVTCLSFYPTKNLGALGDAGAVLTNDTTLARTLAELRVHGESAPGLYSRIGINSRMDAIQAVALAVKLRHLDGWARARSRLASHYDALLLERGAATGATPLDEALLPVRPPVATPDPARHGYHRYVVRVPAACRAGLIRALEDEGIASEIYYRRGLHEQPALARFRPSEPLPEIERACRETLALPLYPEMGLARVERVVDAVARHLKR